MESEMPNDGYIRILNGPKGGYFEKLTFRLASFLGLAVERRDYTGGVDDTYPSAGYKWINLVLPDNDLELYRVICSGLSCTAEKDEFEAFLAGFLKCLVRRLVHQYVFDRAPERLLACASVQELDVVLNSYGV